MRIRTVAAAALTALLVGGCGSNAEPVATAAEFAGLVGQGTSSLYVPMGTPQDVLAERDLVVRGTVTDILEGMVERYADDALTRRLEGSYVTFRVTVGEVLAGDASLVTDGEVFVQVDIAGTTRVADLAAANPRPEAVLILTDLGDWRPHEDATVVVPDPVPAHAPVLWADPDGLWLQTPNDHEMVSVHAHRHELDPAWGNPRTLDDLVEALTACRDVKCG